MSAWANLPPLRWLATITYRTDSGPTDVDHAFEELDELHDLVEAGPSWDCIETITIRLNPRRPQPRLTIEEAETE
jgi:hypothetical protein